MEFATDPGLSLVHLPADVLYKILEALDACDLSMLACTCRCLATRALDEDLWHDHCSRKWRHWSALQIAKTWHNKYSNRWMVSELHTKHRSGSHSKQQFTVWRDLHACVQHMTALTALIVCVL